MRGRQVISTNTHLGAFLILNIFVRTTATTRKIHANNEFLELVAIIIGMVPNAAIKKMIDEGEYPNGLWG